MSKKKNEIMNNERVLSLTQKKKSIVQKKKYSISLLLHNPVAHLTLPSDSHTAPSTHRPLSAAAVGLSVATRHSPHFSLRF